MDITFTGRHTTVPERFRRHAAVKLAKLEKLDARVVRVDVEVSQERNPRQADHSERVELTIRSRGPAIRAEAAADDRYAALDLAFAKLEGRLRRAAERRKGRREASTVRSPGILAAVGAAPAAVDGTTFIETANALAHDVDNRPGSAAEGVEAAISSAGLVPIQMEGDGPLVVREKVHTSQPMTIDQALLEMELVGHDFYLFHDSDCNKFSVVYRRRGYDYGVIRLVEED
ncbi:MAG TPA: ribosome-associated translation inhibitor RaiA [Trebonia sp.]|jgi:ribosomal subunit interface protein|nr:ribosome-associated translation inhibitor RaiA [Trebonia sp.]